MAARTFHINTEPHAASVGDVTLLFQPEVVGAEFASAYAELREVQKSVKGNKASSTKHAKDDDTSPETLLKLNQAMRSFLAGFMLPESAAVFNRFEVTHGKTVEAFATRELADARAEELGATDTVRDASLRLPDRILVALMEWVAELYGSAGDAEGKTDGPGGQSSASS